MAVTTFISELFGNTRVSETFPHRCENAILFLTKWQRVWKCIWHTDWEMFPQFPNKAEVNKNIISFYVAQLRLITGNKNEPTISPLTATKTILM